MRERHVDDLLDAAGLRGHHHAAVAEQQRLLDRMGDVDHGLAGLLPDAHQLGLQDHPVLRVERRERLVHQQHRRVGHEGARDGAALPHAAGELVRIVPPEFREADELERGLDPRAASAAGTPRVIRPKPTLASTLIQGNRPLSWNTMAFSTAQPGASTLMLPPVWWSSPARMRSSVDLPQPLGPTMQTNFAGRDLEVDVVERQHAAGPPLTYSLRNPAISIAAPRRWTPVCFILLLEPRPRV